MGKVVVVGGGLSGCAAAAAAARAGAHVTLLERVEMLGGCADYAGVISHESYCFIEEFRAMGCADIFDLLDKLNIHRNVYFPWPKEESGSLKDMYDASGLDTALKQHLEGMGVEVRLQSRAKDVVMEGSRIRAVVLDDESKIEGDTFVDATGGAGGIENCKKYGFGCVMCFFRCPAFGGRVSIAAKAGVKELKGKKADGTIGPTGAAVVMLKETLAPGLQRELEQKGVLIIPLPKDLVNYKRNQGIGNSVNVDVGYAENIVLAHIGGPYAKRIAGGWAPISELRQVPGFERVRYADPYAGTKGAAIRFMAVTPRDDALRVPGVDNLLVASEKLGLIGLVTTASAGALAGHNAAVCAVGKQPLVLPTSIMVGYWLKYVNDRWDGEGLIKRVHVRGPFLAKARELGVYSTDAKFLHERIASLGLKGVLSKRPGKS